jgi:hypothetical protein
MPKGGEWRVACGRFEGLIVPLSGTGLKVQSCRRAASAMPCSSRSASGISATAKECAKPVGPDVSDGPPESLARAAVYRSLSLPLSALPGTAGATSLLIFLQNEAVRQYFFSCLSLSLIPLAVEGICPADGKAVFRACP